jgi:site-specific recombinase XerD
MATSSSTDLFNDTRRRLVTDGWRQDGYSRITIKGYSEWAKRFSEYCHRHGISERESLTAAGVVRFARWYARDREIVARWVNASAPVALHAWSRRFRALGVEVPPWRVPPRPPWFASTLAEFIDHRRRFRGVSESSVRSERWFVSLLLRSLRHHRVSSISAGDVDRCIAQLSEQMSKGTVADGCSAFRAFLRFLHATGGRPRIGRRSWPGRSCAASSARLELCRGRMFVASSGRSIAPRQWAGAIMRC